MKVSPLTGLALAIAALSGCSTIEQRAAIDARADTVGASQDSRHGHFQRLAADANRSATQRVERPWITGKAQPLARDVTLPVALRANVNTTLIYADGQTDLINLAERIQRATGIPVKVNADALLPADAFLPRLADNKISPSTPLPSQADTLVPAISLVAGSRMAGPGLTTAQAQTVKTAALPTGSAPLATILDAISMRLSVYWRYDPDTASIVFFRTETRTFNIRALAQAAATDLELGLSGNSGGSTNSGGGKFASQGKSSFKSEKREPLLAVVGKIEQMLTRAGVVAAPDGGANSIVVTDTKDALDRVAKFLDAENKALTRRVRLVVEEVTLETTDANEAGVDWNIVFNSGGRGNNASFNGIGSLLDSTLSSSDLAAGVGSGPWSGTGVSLKAVAQLGTIVRHTKMPMLALNRRPATYAVRDSFTYISGLEQTQSTSDSTAPTVTVTQEEDTVGTFLTVVPDAQEDGQVLLTLAYDDTRLVSLDKQTFGDSSNPSFVQQPNIKGQGAIQQVELRPGQSQLVAGYEQSADNYTHRRVNKGASIAFGGSDAGQQKRVVTLLFVTAIPEEGF
jgi:type IVB pilus formation R64 PilN family outer membrane protein